MREDIYDMALVELGLTEDQFYRMPPRHTFLMQLQNRRKIERQWERTRYVAAMIHNMAIGQKRRLTPKRLVPLSVDKKQNVPEMTPERVNELIEKWVKKN